MKDLSDVVACVCDYGTFTDVAKMLAKKCRKVYLHSPCEQEFLDMSTVIEGWGIPNVERLDQPLDPAAFNTIDLWAFPDRGHSGLQRHLRSLGKAVWGSGDVYYYEDSRTRFMDLLKELGLPTVKSVPIIGLTKLADYLKTVNDKYIKVNRFRDNMETWHHIDYEHSRPELRRLADQFGGAMEQVIFVVQDKIETDIEVGYDGFSIDGEYPETSFGGYEAKNEAYAGVWSKYSELPKQVREVNEAIAPVLKRGQYRNSIATEIRIKDDIGYFIDPTFRTPGQTGEHLMETCTNLAEIMWAGANGILVQPKFSHKFAVESTMHYTADDSHEMVLRIPEKAERWVKLYHYYMVDGMCYFPPRRNDEVGVVIGLGDTLEKAIESLKSNFDLLKDEPVRIKTEAFAELIESINSAQAQGVKFTDKKIPPKEVAL